MLKDSLGQNDPVGSGFSGSWEKLTGVQATQDEVDELLFGDP